MRRRHLAVPLSFTLAFLLAACSADSGSHPTVITDPDGIRAVVNGERPSLFRDPLPILRTEDEVVIGNGDGPREDLLPQAPPGAQTALLADGGIGVLVYRPPELRRYDPAGRRLWTVGRAGEGPGEFDFPHSVEWRDGTGWIVSTSIQNRIVVFDDGGHLQATRPTHQTPFLASHRPLNFAPGGGFWYLGINSERREGAVVSVFHLLYADWDSLQAAEVVAYSNPPNIEEGTTFWMHDDIPRLLAVDDRGRAWVNHELDYEIEVYSPDGRERWRLRRPFQRQPYSKYHRHLMEDEPQIQTPQYRMFIKLPDLQPAIYALQWSDRGEMWAFTRAYVDSPYVQVDVFDAEGIWRQAFLADQRFANYPIVGDHLLHTATGEDGSPLLVRARWWIEER